ncbi:TRAP transporter small permease subunit [Stappia sp.]|jgi:TRAP-type C4-dicarboxylate transport system permease small subunit|uniref:TRAP transporter small permease subunit n=1 Tax=Stappia sp. TaxID=1870903 RepID=UPI003A9A2A40
MVEKALNRLSFALASVAALALLLMMLHVTADVAGKYLFNKPIPGTAEVVASYYMISVVFLPLAWLEATNGPITVDLFYELSPDWMKRGMLVLGTVLSLVLYAVLAWLSWKPAMHAWNIGEIVEGAWKVTIWPTKFLLPIGLGLACVALALRLVLILSGRDVTADGPAADHADPA